tara:strand:- start:722 stop:955 length:234 start_codon:yes stop_codon:yes gene_type:complete
MKGDRFIINVGDFIKVSIKVLIKKLSLISLSLKNKISSIYVTKIINEENMTVKINNEKENSLIKYLIKRFGVYLFII